MAAYDNVSLPGAPNIATAGNFAQQLYSMLSALPQDYQKGQDFQYQQRQRNLFQGGVPTTDGQPNGPMDYTAMLRQVLQSGGAPAIGAATPLLSAQAGGEISNAIGGGQPQQPNIGPATSTHAGPANITGDFGGQGGQPKLSATGSDNAGADTINSLAAESHVDLDQFLARYPGARGLLDRDLTPGQASGIRQRMAQFNGGGTAGNTTKPVVSTGYEHDENNTNDATPVGSTGGAQVSPNPQGAGRGVGETFDSRFNAAKGGAQPGARPTPVGTEAEARKAIDEGQNLLKIAARVAGLNPKAAEQAKAAAEQRFDRAKQIFESLGTYNKPTDKERDVASGAEMRAAQIKDDTTRYGKTMASIQGSASAANRQLQHIQLAEGIYKNPDFYSGAGEGLNLMYKRVVNALNPGNTESLPQEAFRKTMAASVLNQVEQLKDDTAAAGGGGRIFQAQIELMEKAANNPDNSVAANRTLTEINKRASLEAKHIAQMANNYKGGHLDAQFAQMVDDYYTKHPMFTPDEIRDIRLIAPPSAPKLDSQEQAAAWARKAGLKPGDPMKLPSGRIVPAP